MSAEAWLVVIVAAPFIGMGIGALMHEVSALLKNRRRFPHD